MISDFIDLTLAICLLIGAGMTAIFVMGMIVGVPLWLLYKLFFVVLS